MRGVALVLCRRLASDECGALLALNGDVRGVAWVGFGPGIRYERVRGG